MLNSRYKLKTGEEVAYFPPIQNTSNPYATEAAMHLDQSNQLEGYGYLVDGVGAFTYLGTLAGTAADYEGFGGGASPNADFPAYIFDGYTPYESTDSISEPHFTKMTNGNILMVYRKSTLRWHQGNDGHLVGKISTDEGKTFGAEFVVFDDGTYDNRNAVIGLLPNGNVVVVFYTSNVISPSNTPFIALSYVTSADNGFTWSAKTDFVTTGDTQAPHGKIITRGTDVYFVTYVQGATENLVKLWKSTDSFATIPTATTIITDATKTLVEPMFVDIAGGKSILLARNNTTSVGQLSFYQYNSLDGLNFTYKGMTNLWGDLNHSVSTSVNMIVDTLGKLHVISPQRNINFYQADQDHAEDSLRIYSQDPEVVYASEVSYDLKHEIPRPSPNKNAFYGYPTSIEVSDGILIGICDKIYHEAFDDYNNFNELASIYTFKLLPVANITEVKALGIKNNKSSIQNGYGLSDGLDFKSVSRYSELSYYLKKSDSLKIRSTISSAKTLERSDTKYWLDVTASMTLTVPQWMLRDIEFQGQVSSGATLTIIGDGVSLNQFSPGTNPIVITGGNGVSFRIKIMTSTYALVTVYGGEGLDLRASNLANDLTTAEQDGIKTKLSISRVYGYELMTSSTDLNDAIPYNSTDIPGIGLDTFYSQQIRITGTSAKNWDLRSKNDYFNYVLKITNASSASFTLDTGNINNEIWEKGTASNDLTIPVSESIEMFNDGFNWVVRNRY